MCSIAASPSQDVLSVQQRRANELGAAIRGEEPDTEGWDACAVFCGRVPCEGSALDGPTLRLLALCDVRFFPLLDTIHAVGTDYRALRAHGTDT
jgi:hypothetical protein